MLCQFCFRDAEVINGIQTTMCEMHSCELDDVYEICQEAAYYGLSRRMLQEIRDNEEEEVEELAPTLPIPTTFPKSIKVADECSICSDTVCRVVLGCQHTVCVSCVQKIVTCPLCRHTIDIHLVKSV